MTAQECSLVGRMSFLWGQMYVRAYDSIGVESDLTDVLPMAQVYVCADDSTGV